MRGAGKYFLTGLIVGVIFAVLTGALFYRWGIDRSLAKLQEIVQSRVVVYQERFRPPEVLSGEILQSASLANGQRFGTDGWLTAQVFGNGRFQKDADGQAMRQTSPSYRDSAVIRSSDPLPRKYRLTVVVGGIDYGLEKIQGLSPDPEFSEGPLNENGCYLLTITDTPPVEPHTNIWWHQHRKVAVDVDNNAWGHGMPNPMFMVYFNRDNRLRAYNPQTKEWGKEWESAIHYDPAAFYRITVEKTDKWYKFELAEENGKILQRAQVPVSSVWRNNLPDYFVVGEPHANYYQGSMRIREITLNY